MGYIEKALKKALAERQELNGRTAAERSDLAPISRGTYLPPEEITYTTTRCVPVEVATLQHNRILAGGANPLIAESYRHLRTKVLQKTAAEHRNVLMITSPIPNEGKSLTTINQAISIAQELTQTVLLVDADLRAPALTKYFGLSEESGLLDYLEGKKAVPELLVHPQGLDRLVLLPAGQPTEWATELIRSPRMQGLVPEVKHHYPDRYVLFDLPPLLSYADALAFAPMVDGIIVVVEARRTPREDLAKCKEALASHPVLGYVFNKAEHVSTKRYYQRYYQRYGQGGKGHGGQGGFWRRLFGFGLTNGNKS